MDEVEAVARAICANYMHNDPDATLDDAVAIWGTDARDVTRAVIAALDACRGTGVIDHMSVVAIAREAGLREAAAVADKMRNHYAAEAILALIDAGSQKPPGSD